MNFVKYLRVSTIILCLISLVSRAEIPIIHLKGMTSSPSHPDIGVKQPYQNLSPALGALYWNSPYLKNVYQFAPSDAPLTRLVQELFHMQPDGSFDTTLLYTNIGYYFDGRTIGTLVGRIFNIIVMFRKMEQEPIEQKLNSLQDQLNELEGYMSNGFIEEQSTQIAQSLLKHHKTNLATIQQSIAHIDKQLSDLSNESSSSVQITKNPLFDKLNREKAKLVSRYKYNKTLIEDEIQLIDDAKCNEVVRRSGQLTSNAKRVGAAIIQTVETELRGYYPLGTTINVLLAFLWKKATDMTQLRAYLDEVARALNIQITNTLYYWPNNTMSEYTRADYEQFKNKQQEEIPQMSLDELIFVRFGYDLYDNPVPPKVNMIGNAIFEGTPFPDCGETSLRNLLNVVSYDTEHKRFDPTIIQALLGSTVPETMITDTHEKSAVLAYYMTNQSTEKIKTNRAHNDWATVVSGLNNTIKYSKHGRCDIQGGFNNMIKVITALFPQIQTLQNFADKLNQSNKTIKCIVNTDGLRQSQDIHDLVGDVIITIKKPASNEITLVWHFLPHHFELDLPPTHQIPFAKKYAEALLHNKGDISPAKAFIGALFSTSYESLKNIDVLQSANQYLYLLPLNSDNEKCLDNICCSQRSYRPS